MTAHWLYPFRWYTPPNVFEHIAGNPPFREAAMTANEYAADAMDNASLRYAGSIDSGATDSEYTLPPYIYGTLAAMGNPPYHHQPERLVLETGTPGVTAQTHICAQHELIQALQEQIDAERKARAQQDAELAKLRACGDSMHYLYNAQERRIAHLEALVHGMLNEGEGDI